MLASIPLVVCVIALILLAKARIQYHRFARSLSTERAWLLLLGGVLLHFGLVDGGFLTKLLAVIQSLGVGTAIGAVWKALEETPARSSLAAGLLLLGVSYGGTWLAEGGSSDRSHTEGEADDSGELSELLVELGPDDKLAEVAATLERFKATSERAFPNVDLNEDEDLAQYFIVRCAAEDAEALSKALQGDTENVDHVEPNLAVSIIPHLDGQRKEGAKAEKPVTNDPMLSSQWALEYANGLEALTLLYAASPRRRAKVAIIDTGVHGEHEDLKTIFGGDKKAMDPHGHGTHCAGIAGAVANNGIGMASFNLDGRFVEISSYAALGPRGGGRREDIAQAIVDAAEAGADVLSLSLGGYAKRPPQVYIDAVEYANKLGAIVVVAAGNSSEAARNHTPANVPGVIVVTALDRGGKKARFTNTIGGLDLPIAAPGVDILSAKPGGGYVNKSGTSMATPLVAGLIGVLRALRPKLRTVDVHKLLVKTGRDIPDKDGLGKAIDAARAIQAVLFL